MATQIRIRNASKVFRAHGREVEALRDISFDDDTFSADRRHARAVAEKIAPLGVSWVKARCFSSADEAMDALKQKKPNNHRLSPALSAILRVFRNIGAQQMPRERKLPGWPRNTAPNMKNLDMHLRQTSGMMVGCMSSHQPRCWPGHLLWMTPLNS